jgi:hypothetical protein
MGHDSSLLLLFDLLMDFPVNAILQRVGLIETLLDVIGSTVVNNEPDEGNSSLLSLHLTKEHS